MPALFHLQAMASEKVAEEEVALAEEVALSDAEEVAPTSEFMPSVSTPPSRQMYDARECRIKDRVKEVDLHEGHCLITYDDIVDYCHFIPRKTQKNIEFVHLQNSP